MPDETPPLIIPVRFSIAGAAADLQKFHAQTAQASAQAQATATRGAQAASQAQVKAARDATALIAQANRELADKQKQAAADAFAQWKRLHDEQHSAAMRAWEEEKSKRVQAARDATALIAQANRDLADKSAAAASRAADRQKQAAADAFADWKKKADEQHRAAMWLWEDQQSAIKKTAGEARSFGDELAGLMKAQMAMNAVLGVGRAIGDVLNRAADHARQTAQEFVSLRRTMQEVAALRGRPNSDAFTLEEAREARAAGLTPEERRDFQAQFLNYAGSQVSDTERVGEGQKLTASQGAAYGNRVAALMKASGVNPAVGAELAGSLLEQAEGPQDVDQLMGRFSKTFQVLQKGRVPLNQALPQISQIMSMGVSAEDAAKMFSIVSPAAAGQEGTSVQAALRAIQEMKNAGTGAEFGVREGMGQYESVKAFARNINDRQQAFVAGGLTQQEAADRVQKLLAEKRVAADSREARGLVRGFGDQGVRLGGFARFEAIERATPADFEAGKVAEYRDSDAGRQGAREADEAVARAERGKINVKLEELRQEARTQLTREGRFESAAPGDVAEDYGLKAIGRVTGKDYEESLVDIRAIAIQRRRAGYDDSTPRRRAETAIPASEGGGVAGFESAATVNAALLRLIERQNRLLDQQQRPPLAAPPPMRGAGARMGG